MNVIIIRTENKSLLALFSVRLGTWVDLCLGLSITCTLITLELLTGIHGKVTDCIRCVDVDNSHRHNAFLYDCLSILTLLTLHLRNYTRLLIALRLPVPVISDLKL